MNAIFNHLDYVVCFRYDRCSRPYWIGKISPNFVSIGTNTIDLIKLQIYDESFLVSD